MMRMITQNPSKEPVQMKFGFAQKGDTIELYIYDDITEGGVDFWTGKKIEGTSEQLRSLLEENNDAKRMNIFINSNGGDVFECYAVMSMLERFKAYKTAYIDGLAASAASLLPLACDKIVMASYSSVMIHNMWTFCMGNANDLRAMADTLDKLMESNRAKYMERFKGTEEELIAMMDAETFLSAKDCLALGLCDEIAQKNGDNIEDPDEDDDDSHTYESEDDEKSDDSKDDDDGGEASKDSKDEDDDKSDDDESKKKGKKQENESFFEKFKKEEIN